MSTFVNESNEQSGNVATNIITTNTLAEPQQPIIASSIMKASVKQSYQSLATIDATKVDPYAPNTDFGVIVANGDQIITHVNEAFTSLTGYGRAETIGRRANFLQGPATNGVAIETLRTALRDGNSTRVHILNYRKDGEPFWLQLTIAPMLDINGRVNQWVGIQISATPSGNVLGVGRIHKSITSHHPDDSDDEHASTRAVIHGSLATRRKISSNIAVTTPLPTIGGSATPETAMSPVSSSSSNITSSLPTSASTGCISSLVHQSPPSPTTGGIGMFAPTSPCPITHAHDHDHHEEKKVTAATNRTVSTLGNGNGNDTVPITTGVGSDAVSLPPTSSLTTVSRDDAKAEVRREEEEVKMVDGEGNVTVIRRLKILPKSTTTTFVAETLLPTTLGKYRIRAYTDSSKPGTNNADIIAMIWGNPEGLDNVVCRVHDQCFTSEVLGSLKCDCREQLDFAKEYIQTNDSGSGIIIYMPQEGRGIGLANKIKAYHLQESGYDTVDANRALGFGDDLREYSAVPYILDDLRIKSVRLMTNNPRKIDTLNAYNITVTDRIPVMIPSNPHSDAYLKAKRSRMGHLSA